MNGIQLAKPWWVNLCALVPILVYGVLRRHKPQLAVQQLISAGVFGIGFAFIEAAVVVYLRAATGLLVPSHLQNILMPSEQKQILSQLPEDLLLIEVGREAATIITLLALAFLSASQKKERVTLFLWVFATWDVFYYFFLWLTIGWPNSLLTGDVLFLIPVPWMSQVWFPLLVSASTLAAIAINWQKPTRSTTLEP